MGQARAGLLVVAVALVLTLTLPVACNFGIETEGLVGNAEAALDGSPKDVVDRIEGSSGHDAGVVLDSGGSDHGPVADARPPPDTSVLDTSVPETSIPCSVIAVSAVPGTSEYQVIGNANAEAQSITLGAGHLLVAVAYGGQNPGESTPITTVPNMTFAVSDTLGNTFYAGSMIQNSNNNQAAIQIFYAANVKGGSDTVTASSNASGSSISLWTGLFLQEYSGIATTDVVDVGSGQMAPSSTRTVTPGSATTTTACDLVVGAFTDGHVGGQNLNAGTGWTFRSTDDWDPGGAVDNAPGGASKGTAVDATMYLTGGNDNGWVAAQLAFRGAGTTAPAQPDSVAFVSSAQTVGKGACSNAVFVQSNHGSAAANTATGIKMTLSAPAGVSFYIDPNCAYPITDLYIGAGTSSQTFYFTSANTGTVALGVTSGTLTASQNETID
jgi:hypothetical protein